MRIAKIGPMHVFVGRDYKYLVLFGKLYINLNLRDYRLYKSIRGLFPSFWYVGLHDCDSGGRIFASYPVLAWNDRHILKIRSQGNGGDGPDTWRKISFFRFIKWKYTILKNERVTL